MLSVQNISKSFTLHLRGGTTLPVINNASFELSAGECVALTGPSGIGKSSVLKMIYGSYRTESGAIMVRANGKSSSNVDICKANARELIALRKNSVGMVSQFLRVVPRVTSIDLVCEPAIQCGTDKDRALAQAESLLTRLNMAKPLWQLPPATFSGGEQQRINIARGFIGTHPVLLLDEPTASLDERNRDIVIELINEKKAQGKAILGIFHDPYVRQAIADQEVNLTKFMMS